MKTLKDIEYLEGVRVLIRVDFNVPVASGAVVDDFRIRMALPTIEYLRSRGAKVIMISHIEGKEGTSAPAKNDPATLKPVAERLNQLGVKTEFVTDYMKAAESIDNLGIGGCILLENLRTYKEEKANDGKFAQSLASLADIYINEAFSVSHRAHASVVGVPKLMPSYAGLNFEKEVTNLSKAFEPDHPFVFVLGGAKFQTKLPLVQRFIKTADKVFVGGALVNDILRVQGLEIGKSLVSETDLAVLKPIANDKKLLMPIDVRTVGTGGGRGGDMAGVKVVECAIDRVTKDQKIVDVGAKTSESLSKEVANAKFILWNGPLGLYEAGFKASTLDLASAIAKATKNGATSIVGGGDTLAAIALLGLEKDFTFVSTAGGAMLDFLADGTLPGIEALG